jgi:hypothetical protein
MSYDPSRLLDALRDRMQLRNDAALARMLEVSLTTVQRVREKKAPIGASLLIRMFEVTGISIRDLRDLMGDRRSKYRLADSTWANENRAANVAPTLTKDAP